MFELREIEQFLAVAAHRNFGRAAAALGISQPPLSRRIAALERELGVALFSREHRQIELTPAGRALEREAHAVLAQARLAVHATREAARGTSGRLRLGYRGTSRFRIVPAAINLLHERHPEASIAIAQSMTELLLDHLRLRATDMATLSGPFSADGLCVERLCRSPLMAALPAGHRLSRRAVVAVSDLADEPFVEVAQRESIGYREMTRAVCAAAGFVPRVVQEVDAIDASVACVAAGIGVALVHGENDVPLEGVAYRPIEPPGPQVETVAAWRADNDNPLIPLFLDCLRTAATRLHGPLLAAAKSQAP